MWPNPQFPADLVTFTEETMNWKFHFWSIGIECDLSWLKRTFILLNAIWRNDKFTSFYQFCLSALEGMFSRFIYSSQHHGSFLSVSTLLVKLTAFEFLPELILNLITCFSWFVLQTGNLYDVSIIMDKL